MHKTIVSASFGSTYEKTLVVKTYNDARINLKGSTTDRRADSLRDTCFRSFSYDISERAAYDLGKALIEASGIKETDLTPVRNEHLRPLPVEETACGSLPTIAIGRSFDYYEVRQGGRRGDDVVRFERTQGKALRDALVRLFPFENGAVIPVHGKPQPMSPAAARTSSSRAPQAYKGNGKHEWEVVTQEGSSHPTTRLRVPGGWLYRHGSHVSFVPMPEVSGHAI